MTAAARTRPSRRLRYEIYSLAAVLSFPVAMALAFPYGAVSFSASEPPARPEARCAFVSLSDEDESSALAAARAAWKVSAEGVRSMRLDLSVDSAPEDPVTSVSEIGDRARCRRYASVGFDAPALPPTLAAPAPAAIAPEPEPEDAGLAFPRREMLKAE